MLEGGNCIQPVAMERSCRVAETRTTGEAEPMSACAGCARLTAERDEARNVLECIALVTAYDQPLPGSIAGHVSVVVGDLLQERDALAARVTALEGALELVLMFYGAAYWNEPESSRWREITGKDEATTKVMCDHIRALLASPRGSARPPAALEGR